MTATVDMATAALNAVHVAPVSMKVDGWSASTYILAVIAAALTPFVVALLRFWPTMRKLKDSADGSLRSDLMKRVTEVETDLRNTRIAFDKAITEERRDCERRLDGYQKKMDAITRKFFQFQLSLVRYLPSDAMSMAQQTADHVMEIIGQPVENFMEPDDSNQDDDLLKKLT